MYTLVVNLVVLLLTYKLYNIIHIIYFKTEIAIKYFKIEYYESKFGNVRILRSK